jgi:S1-C subfamily serine protease
MGFKPLLVAVVLAILLVGCDVTDSADSPNMTTSAAPTTAASVETTAAATPGTTAPPLLPSLDLYDVSDLVKQVRPGVVSVTQERVQIDFFGVPEEVPAGAGTGIVIDDTGHILTNFHVIEGASAVIVTAADGVGREATVVAQASTRDLALLEIDDATGLEPLPLGDLTTVEVGDPVIAIGNALGLDSTDPTVSAGIVSATGRTISTQLGTLQELVQTDAAINPGNSGGPLLNASGEVIGINTAIAGGAQNIGFAISVETAKQFIERYRLGVGEPFIGVQMVDNSPAAASQLELAVDAGALVIEIVPGSPAAAAGLQQWDVIVAIDGTTITTGGDVIAAVQQTVPGDEVAVEVVRSRDTRTLTVTVGERPPGT